MSAAVHEVSTASGSDRVNPECACLHGLNRMRSYLDLSRLPTSQLEPVSRQVPETYQPSSD
jgi:hypothetical protein